MELFRVEVDGFRGLQLEIELSPTTVIIGESRVGKTTLLDVLERCLGLTRPADAPFVPDDFEDGPIEVVLEFAGPLVDGPLEELSWRFHRRDHLALRVRAKSHDDVTWAFVDAARNTIIEPAPASLRDQIRELHPLLLLASERFMKKGAVEAAQKGGEQTLQDLFMRVFMGRGAMRLGELKEGLEALQRVTGESKDTFRATRSTRKMMREIVEAPGRMRALPSEVFGSMRSTGSQSLALFLLVAWLLEVRGEQALAEGAEPILALEEPELHLHPIVSASLWGILQLLPAQKLITTNSPELLGAAPLSAVRRLTRDDGHVRVHRLRKGILDLNDLRRIGFHMRLQRGSSLFARCWLLVEGESEVWLLPELARLCGVVFPSEGIECISFAQCGLVPIVRLADAMGIAWHLLADGDDAGAYYEDMAYRQLEGRPPEVHITRLPEHDIEQFLWHNGFQHIYKDAARGKPVSKKERKRRRRRRGSSRDPRAVIYRALHKSSKPEMALRVAIAAGKADGPGVPPLLRELIERVAGLAREGSAGSFVEAHPGDVSEGDAQASSAETATGAREG